MPGELLRFIGTADDLHAFRRRFDAELAVPGVSVADPVPWRDDTDRIGHVELVEVFITFASSVAARAAYDALKHAFDRFRQGRNQASLQDLEDREQTTSNS